MTMRPGKSVQLRLECIDALETHYTSGSSRFTNQPLGPAKAARAHLLEELIGFQNVRWDEAEEKVVDVDEDEQPGYILARTFDSYGQRPVAYAFAGDAPEPDGADVFLKPARLRKSINYKMVEAGYAYPMYYQGAFHDLREELDKAAEKAKGAAASNPENVWATDETLSGIGDPPDRITLDVALWPKLFRRLSSFYKDDPSGALADFPSWLEAHRDECFDLDTGSWTALHNYVIWKNGKLRMTKSFQRLLFQG
jgi:endonuclease YncB( thermonuclease family)